MVAGFSGDPRHPLVPFSGSCSCRLVVGGVDLLGDAWKAAAAAAAVAARAATELAPRAAVNAELPTPPGDTELGVIDFLLLLKLPRRPTRDLWWPPTPPCATEWADEGDEDADDDCD